MSERLLLDTHAALWLTGGATMAEPARAAIRSAVQRPNGVLVSPISAWEVALLVQRGRVSLEKGLSPLSWFDDLVARQGFAEADLGAEILTASVDLPDSPPNDPLDRILTATARSEDVTLVTRDRELLAYAARGHVRCLPC